MTAGNSGHAMVKQYTDTQTLLEIFNRAETQKKPNYEEISTAVARFRRDDEVELIKALCMFGEAWAGGGSTHLLELDRWSKTLDIRRAVQAWAYITLAKVGAPMPRLIYGILKTFYSSPVKYMVHGYSQILTPGDVNNINGKEKAECEASTVPCNVTKY